MRKIELLAPAGNAAAALAAFDAGADAVYAGLAKFNARERSENFTPESMAKIIAHAHRNGRKVYVTVNTIVKERELPEVAEYLAMLAEMGPDALIVQDLGVLRMIREFFPTLAIHASTQMGFHNSPGLALAAKIGVKRVILERQITFEELKTLGENSPVELEMFVHGALCCSLSGECLFSSWLGGASGNRGRCKQPCRRRFFSNRGNGFFFSTQDLCLIDKIDEIANLGVVSLKIEGRLRQADYVKNTVAAYRLMLDAAPDADRGKLIGEARNLLSRTCGRKWSHGFATPESTQSLISFDSLGAAGLLCGVIVGMEDNGFYFTTTRNIHVGDRIRVQPQSGDDGAAMTITRMFVNNASALKARPGDRVFVCCDKPMPFKGMVFKIGESCEDYTARIAALPPPPKPLHLKIAVNAGTIRIAVANAPLADWSLNWNLTAAESRPLQKDTLETMFREADSEVFAAGGIDCAIDGDWFVPVSELKAARREFWNFVKANLQPEAVFSDAAVGLEKFRLAQKSISPAAFDPFDFPETVAVRPNGELPGNRKAIRATSVYEVSKLSNEAILPEFCPEGKVASLTKVIGLAYEQGIRRFRVPAIYGLELLRSYAGITVTAGGALPVCNSMAVLELQSLGADKVLAHVELEREALLELAAHAPLPVELYRLGRPVLLVTRAKIPSEGDFRDSRSNEFCVKFDRRDHLTRVYPKEVVSVPRLPGMLDFYDITQANWNARDVSEFNFNSELQ
jgi:putative protease